MDIVDKSALGSSVGYRTFTRRIIFEGGIYHITQRAPGREVIFVEEADYLFFLKTFKDVSKEFQLKIYCFALLPNHLHLLLEIKEKNLSEAMKTLFGTYAKYFNKKYNRKGHVFCGRFRASICYDETYFIVVSVYIHLNPIRAGLCGTLRDFRWSSVHLYIDKPRESFVDSTRVLSYFHHDHERAALMYEEMLLYNARKNSKVLIEQRSFRDVFSAGITYLRAKVFQCREDALSDVTEDIKNDAEAATAKSYQGKSYVVRQLLANGHSPREIQVELNISRATFYKMLNKKVKADLCK